MMWNCQGAGAPEFRRVFMYYMKKFKPSVVALYEPRISGWKADDFIQHSGFHRSHRVEAIGYSGGIWILWREQVEVDVIENHRQYIHTRITFPDRQSSLVSFIYASPVSANRKFLWKELNRIALSMGDRWLVRGDFNPISNTSEKMGGSRRLSAVCCL